MHGNMFLLEGWDFCSGHLGVKHWMLPKPLCQEINVIVYRGFLVSPSVSLIFCLFFSLQNWKNIETLHSAYMCLQAICTTQREFTNFLFSLEPGVLTESAGAHNGPGKKWWDRQRHGSPTRTTETCCESTFCMTEPYCCLHPLCLLT